MRFYEVHGRDDTVPRLIPRRKWIGEKRTALVKFDGGRCPGRPDRDVPPSGIVIAAHRVHLRDRLEKFSCLRLDPRIADAYADRTAAVLLRNDSRVPFALRRIIVSLCNALADMNQRFLEWKFFSGLSLFSTLRGVKLRRTGPPAGTARGLRGR